MIPESFKKQAAEGGLIFEGFLPPSLATLVVDLVDQGDFTSPSEAAFVAIKMLEDLRRYPDLHKEFLNRMFTDAEKQIEQGETVSGEEVMRLLKESAKLGQLEPAMWVKSMDRPLFE